MNKPNYGHSPKAYEEDYSYEEAKSKSVERLAIHDSSNNLGQMKVNSAIYKNRNSKSSPRKNYDAEKLSKLYKNTQIKEQPQIDSKATRGESKLNTRNPSEDGHRRLHRKELSSIGGSQLDP